MVTSSKQITITAPRILDRLAPPELHAEIWQACMAKRWYFGNQSVTVGTGLQFWKMDLEDSEPVSRLWERSRAACEQYAGQPLRVVRQYANGHTYGLGGGLHRDDARPGTWTLLYYPMPEWRIEWEGETVWVNTAGEVIAAVRPAPNRAVIFDSRILHAGRAPSRVCGALRVTVAFKLEAAAPA